MAGRVATVEGTFLAPGISKNRRLYTRANIEAAVNRMRARLATAGGAPLTMLSHHGAGDDSTRIAGRVTEVTLNPDGSASWRGDIADTTAGRDIAALVTADQPFLANVSIRGWWLGPVRTETVDGQPVETADDLEIDGIDFTRSPGVAAARITSAALAETAGRTAIVESVEEARVTVTETVVAQADTVTYADPGYQPDGKKRYPLDTTKRVRAAWAYINMDRNARQYTAAQLKRIKGRIKAAAKKAGVDIAAETAAVVAQVTESLEEAWARMCLDNGQGSIAVDGYTNEPEFLPAVGKQVALAALAGLSALDPDNDGDIDLGPDAANAAQGGEGDGDDDMESHDDSATVVETDPKEADMAKQTGTATPPKPLEEMTEEELRTFASQLVTPAEKATETAPAGGATDSTATATPAAETAARALTTDDIPALAEAFRTALAGGTATDSEDEDASAAETAQQPDVAAAVAEAVGNLRDDLLDQVGKLIGRAGIRRGLVRTDETTPGKPLHEMDDDEFRNAARDTWDSILPPVR